MADSCECSDWTQVGHPASAYWPDLHPNYHHPDCPKYTPPPALRAVPHVPRALLDVAGEIAAEGLEPQHLYSAQHHPACPEFTPSEIGDHVAALEQAQALEAGHCLHPGCSGPKTCKQHSAQGRRPEDLTKDELVELVKRMMLQRRPHEKDSLTVWQAVSHLRSLADTIPMLKVLLDYLEPPITEEGGERGVWQVCLMCEKRFFYTLGVKSYDLCIECSKDAGRYQVSLGWGEQAAFLQYTPRDMTLYARPAAREAIANHFRHLADYLEKKP